VFVGRAQELRVFRDFLAGGLDAPPVLLVHGPAGVGTTTLLRHFARLAALTSFAELVTFPTIDPATYEPPDAGLLLIDDVELGPAFDDWLFARLLTTLPAEALVVVATRDRPDPRWLGDAGYDRTYRVLEVRDLSAEESATLLDLLGVAQGRQEPVLAFAGGNPLALRLAAPHASREDPWTPSAELLDVLARRLLGEVGSPAHREALDACAHPPAMTEDLLRAAVGEDRAAELFGWLRTVPFLRPTPAGLVGVQAFRSVLDAELRRHDPNRRAAQRRRMRAHLTARAATDDDALRSLAGLAYPAHAEPLTDSPLLPRDLPAVRRLAGSSTVDFWLAHSPASFRVYHDDDKVIGFFLWLRLDTPDEAETAADPVVAAAWAAVAAAGPLQHGEHLGIARHFVHTGHPADPPIQPVLSSLVRDDGLVWTFAADDSSLAALRSAFDLHPAGDGLLGRDWRAAPLDDLLDGLDRPAPASAVRPAPVPRADFDDQVRVVLRAWRRRDSLGRSPLVHSGLGGHGPDPVDALRQAFTGAIDRLREEPRGDRLHRAVTTTYLAGAPTQEAAAQRLGLPFSTYRRHLGAGVQRLCDLLWQDHQAGLRH
jgi:hypothetical protein